MIPEPLKIREREFRNVVARRQYEELPARMEKLSGLADAYITKLSGNDPRRQELAGWMLATIAWARLMVNIQRQTWSDELGRLPGVGRYLDRPRGQTPRVCVDL